MSFTVPFLRFEHERLEHEASGVLLRIADSAFVLTAFHVLKPLLDAKIPKMIGAGSQDSAGISLSGLRVLKADDPLDIALIELSPEKSEQIVFANSGKSGVLQPIIPLDLPVKVRPWELTVYPRSHIRR